MSHHTERNQTGGDPLGSTPSSNNRSRRDCHSPGSTCTRPRKRAPKAIGKQTTRKARAGSHLFRQKLQVFCTPTQRKISTPLLTSTWHALNSGQRDFRGINWQNKQQNQTNQKQPNQTNPNKNNPTKCLETGRNFFFPHKPRKENSPLKVLFISFSWLPEIIDHGLPSKLLLYALLFVMSDSTLCHLENLPLTSMHFYLSKVWVKTAEYSP